MHPSALIDLDAVTWNYRYLCDMARTAEVAATVKANAYGLGAEVIAKALRSAGCRTFFTAHFSEAVAVRCALDVDSPLTPTPLPPSQKMGGEGLSSCYPHDDLFARKSGGSPSPHVACNGGRGVGVRGATKIAVLHGIDECDYAEAARLNITPLINHIGQLESWARYARSVNVPLPAYIHLDTGMNRMGLPRDEQTRLAENPDLLKGIALRGWISHFARSDEFDSPMTTEQRDAFTAITDRLPQAPRCLCNSSGMFWGRDYLFDLARPGIALYGGNPTPHKPNPMRHVVELQAPILQVHDVDSGTSVGYGASHSVTKNGRVAALALGYADGYHRALSNRGTVKIGDFSAPLIGRISMDLITVDVTDVPESVACAGAMATVIGAHRTIDDVAAEAGTIAYEILTSLGSRVRRVYQEAT